MSDGADLLAAILANPADDNVRLVYADWLEEYGNQPERAEFIRVQVECSKWSEEVALSNLDADWKGKGKRERQLLTALRPMFRAWLPTSKPYCHEWSFYLHRHEDDTPDDYTASLHNGFVYKLTCGAEWFLKNAAAIIWHETQTVPAPKCDACGGTAADERGRWKDKHGHDYWIRCHICKGVDKTPRPCPGTAQPIRCVRLTTWGGHPEVLEDQYLEDRWAGITFELPT